MKIIILILVLLLIFRWNKLSTSEKLLVAIIIGVLCVARHTEKANLEIVPQPQTMEMKDGQGFKIKRNTEIFIDEHNRFNAEYLQSQLKKTFGKGHFQIKPKKSDSRGIIITLADTVELAEAYNIIVDKDHIKIIAGTKEGAFYGVQTLIQMLPCHEVRKVKVPKMHIYDAPRFAYRGMHLDVSRTFFGADFIYRFIDALAYYKINNFHWHLTDDQGWRVEIKHYPKLTEIGAWRGAHEALKPAYASGMERNGGFYTQEEIKAIVKYAADRNINIIPEIDLPGHSKAVAVSYPEILCETTCKHYSVQWESNNVWCVGREENYAMLDTIIGEMAALFPSKIFHIGGDEVNKDSWKECPRCKDIDEPQHHFVKRMEEILARHGKVMAGWDEIMDGGELMPSTVVYAWSSPHRAEFSIEQGHPTVMQVAQYMYFDMKQSEGERGLKWAGVNSLEKAYSFDPSDKAMGVQGGCWGECLGVKDFVDYQVFPKLLALSEIAWCKEKPDFQEFKEVLYNAQYERLDAMGWKFRITPPDVVYEDGKLVATSDSKILKIRYTDDGSEPTVKSKRYRNPIKTDTPEKYRFATFYNGRASIARGAQNIELHHYLKPKTTVESNIPFFEDIERLVDYDLNTYCFTAREIGDGDYVLFTFDEPVECQSIGMCTGYYTLAVYGVLNGYIEYSYDGEEYHRGNRFEYDAIDGYRAYCHPEKPVKSVRIVIDDISEHEVTGIQDLRIE